MAKIAVVTDSNSGITQQEAGEMGIFVLPMPFMIGENQYFEDINLSQEEFYQKLQDGATISTSQPSPESITELWDKILKDYDEIVHIPMSSGLSGSCQSAMMLAEDYDGRVSVVNNQRISVTQRHSVDDALTLVGKGMSAKEIKDFLENDKFNSSIYIMLDTLYYLKKGGRITPAAAAIGTLLKIKPVLQIQGEKLDAFAKARTGAQGKTIMMNAIRSDIESRFGGVLPAPGGVRLAIAHTQNQEAALALKAELEAQYPGYDPIIVNPLSLSVSCHIGPGALAIAVSKKI